MKDRHLVALSAICKHTSHIYALLHFKAQEFYFWKKKFKILINSLILSIVKVIPARAIFYWVMDNSIAANPLRWKPSENLGFHRRVCNFYWRFFSFLRKKIYNLNGGVVFRFVFNFYNNRYLKLFSIQWGPVNWTIRESNKTTLWVQ